jgi:RNA polymerase sigma-70 factor (ECF subfamily)
MFREDSVVASPALPAATLPALSLLFGAGPGAEPAAVTPAGESASPRALDAFLREIEGRALRIAELSTGHREDALEAVQEAMLAFARRYARQPAGEWRALFHRVLDNRLRDQARRRAVRRQWLALASLWSQDNDSDALAQPVDAAAQQPSHGVDRDRMHAALEAALRALPPRQRQAFLLRVWEGLDVAGTAQAMGCGEGSVKTHLSRALAALRPQLEAYR